VAADSSPGSAEFLKATQKEVILQRGVLHTVCSLSVIVTTAWPATASAAESLNLFPDPVKVAIHVAVFLALVYPTSRFLLRPLVRMFEERERLTAGALGQMDTLLGEAAQLRQTLEARLEEARERAHAQRLAVLQEAEEEERRQLVEAREEAARTLEQARASIQEEVETARQTLRTEAEGLARALASKVMGRSV
jgi:F-type H+-transporting ATPase subunit b